MNWKENKYGIASFLFSVASFPALSLYGGIIPILGTFAYYVYLIIPILGIILAIISEKKKEKLFMYRWIGGLASAFLIAASLPVTNL